jgi:hypothetical protein
MFKMSFRDEEGPVVKDVSLDFVSLYPLRSSEEEVVVTHHPFQASTSYILLTSDLIYLLNAARGPSTRTGCTATPVARDSLAVRPTSCVSNLRVQEQFGNAASW